MSDTSSLSVSFSVCSDATGVPDKYKHVVSASAGIGGSVSPESQLVVDNSSASITITPEDNMAVDTITAGDNIYVNNELGGE